MADSRLGLFTILARIRPEIWEIIGGGPFGPRYGDRFGPTPEPWREGPFPEPWRSEVSWALSAQLSAVDLARRLTDAASLVHAQGGDAAGFLRALTEEDWCPSGRPLVVKFPSGWRRVKEPPPPTSR